MKINSYKNNPLYTDRYSPDSNWSKILPVSGRPIQSSELIEIQSLIQGNTKEILDILFGEASRLKGLKIIQKYIDEEAIEIQVTQGNFYVEGFVFNIPAKSFEILNIGTFVIGVKINETIITELDDPNLRDPIKGSSLYGLEGAARLVWTPDLVINDEEAYAIGKVIDGQIIQKEINPIYLVQDILASYIYERNGNFLVQGFNVSHIKTITESSLSSSPNKTNSLQQNIQEDLDNLSILRSQLGSTQSSLDSLRRDLTQALTDSAASPTPFNLARIDSIRESINERERDVSNLYLLVEDKEDNIIDSSITLDSIQNIQGKEVFNVSPGVAYIKGYRVEKLSNTILNIPRNIETNKVISARFTFQEDTAVTNRTISIPTSISVQQIKDNSASIGLTLSPVIFESKLIKVIYKLIINDNLNINSISDILTEFINGIMSNALVSNNVSLEAYSMDSSTKLTISPSIIRALIKSNISVNKLSNTSLSLSTTSVSERNLLVSTEVSGGLLIDKNSKILNSHSKLDYTLGKKLAHEVIQVVAELRVLDHPMIRGQEDEDYLEDDSIYEILEVRQGDKVYVQGLDFNLIDQQYISWAPGGDEPDIGTTYFVSFLYTQPLIENEDYKFDKTKNSISFLPGGRRPAKGYSFDVDYSYSLARAGVIFIDTDTSINYQLSSSSENPIIPLISQDYLPLAYIYIYADRVEILPIKNKRFTVKELRNLEERIRELEVDISNLEDQIALIKDNKDPSLVYNLSSFNCIGDLNKTDSTVSWTPLNNSHTTSTSIKELSLKYESGGVLHKYSYIGDRNSFVTLPYIEESLVRQLRATGYRLITPLINEALSANSNYIRGSIKVYPRDVRVSKYIDNKINPCNSNQLGDNTVLSADVTKDLIRLYDEFSNSTLYGTVLEDTEIQICFDLLETQVNKEILIYVWGIRPNDRHNTIFLDGEEMSYFRILNDASISPDGIRSNKMGEILISIQLDKPMNVGTHLLEIIGTKSYASASLRIHSTLLNQIANSSSINDVSSNYLPTSSQPLAQDIDSQVMNSSNSTGTSILNTSNTLYINQEYSSLSQLFNLPVDCLLLSTNIYLRNLDYQYPLELLIKDTNSFGPGNQTLGIGKCEDYKSDLRAIEPSKFEYDMPILLDSGSSYSLSLNSLSDRYEIFTATLGEPDLNNGYTIGNQPLYKGSLFYSPNGYNIIEDEKSTLTYEHNIASFTSFSSIVSLGNYGIQDGIAFINKFCINCRDILPKGTSITYQYSTNLNNSWKDILPNKVNCLDHDASTLNLRAILSTNSRRISPLLDIESSSITIYTNSTTGILIVKDFKFNKDIDKVFVYYEAFIPNKASVSLSVSTDDGRSWSNFDDTELLLSNNLLNTNEYLASFIPGRSFNSNNLVIRFALISSSRVLTPFVRNIRVSTSNIN